MKATEPDGAGLITSDPWLKPYAAALERRCRNYRRRLAQIEASGQSLDAFSQAYEEFGFNRGTRDGEAGVWYREWAPGADALFAIGDFNDWDRQQTPMSRDEFGVWSVFLPDAAHAERLTHGSRVKVHVQSPGAKLDRIPAYIRQVKQEADGDFTGVHQAPAKPYDWRHAAPTLAGAPRIYEAHIGMAVEAERVGTYAEFTDQVLPRIAAAGYNAVQLMGIVEHPYYGSFGYHVSNLYAPSSRFGAPAELAALVDEAHGLGLAVYLDLVHSHMVTNVAEGLSRFDGTDFQYFHAGARGTHPAWDSLVYDYSKLEVLRFLLANIRYWLAEYRFDGLRFDGVTSMMYLDHGLARDFTSYADYFEADNLDEDAICYLQLANQVAHAVRPETITIAEEVSGMVGLARPADEGGLGFDYRLAMGIPDYWIKLVKEKRDEDWGMGELFHVMTNRRAGENHIAYAEGHDQALVGDKALAFWLMDAHMYEGMRAGRQNPVIDRGVALHKLIRLLTFTLGGEGYLNFMGNEFGHPEWIDFPRAGNDFSYQYARRQWSLVDAPDLRYGHLAAFDRALQALDRDRDLLRDPLIEQLHVHEDGKLLAYRRGPLLAILNFHPNASVNDHVVGVPDAVDYEVILDTDDLGFGGFGLCGGPRVYPCRGVGADERAQSIQAYVPARSGQVLAPVVSSASSR